MTLKLSMHLLEVLAQLFTRTTLPRITHGFRAITTQSDLCRTRENPILMYKLLCDFLI